MYRGRRGPAVILIVTLVAMVFSITAVAIRISSPSSGIAVQDFLPDGVAAAILPGVPGPFLDGDEVTAMAGRATSSWVNGVMHGDAALAPGQAGDIVRFEVRRAGEPLALDVTLAPYPSLGVLVASWGTLAFVLTFLVVAGLVFWRRAREPAAGALLIAAIGGAGSTVPFLLGVDPLDLASGSFLLIWVTTSFVYLLLWAGMIDFVLVFPRPFPIIARRPTLRLAPYVLIVGGYVAGLAVARPATPNALAWFGSWAPIQFIAIGATFATIPGLLIIRWRRGPAEDRQVLRSFLVVGTFMIVAGLVLWLIPEAAGGRPLVPWTVLGLAGLPLPLLIAAAILRHRAFDIDVVVRRSLVYGGLTAAVVATYGLAAALLGALMSGLSPFATSLLATGAAAIVALPIRDGLQRAVTRLLYGDRDEPVRAIRRLGERLAWSVDADSMPRVVVDAVAEALRLPYVGLELGVAPSARLAAERGVRPSEPIGRPLMFRASPVGRLLVDARGSGDQLSDADLRLLDDLTRQIGVAAHATLLTEDLRASRERIVTTREEERRRLRRDLHDGLGPALSAIGMRAEAAETVVRSDPGAAEGLLAELRAEVAAAVVEIRRLVDGLRPPAIDELGLVGAVRLAADRIGKAGAPNVSIEADGSLADLPAAVEVAAYRIATEAMTNAARHAGAARCVVRLVGGADLTVVVEDDGRGLPVDRQDGVGLASMQERAAELGGEFLVEPLPGGGTRVLARLPLAPGGHRNES